MEVIRKPRGEAAAWAVLLTNDPKARPFTASHIARLMKHRHTRTARAWIDKWVADGRVEVMPSKNGWRRQTRRIVANRSPEPEPVVTGVADEGPEPAEANAYVNAVRQ